MLNRMNPMHRIIIVAAFVAAYVAGGSAWVEKAAEGTPDIPPHGPAIVLFDGTSLDNFDSFLLTKGLNSDPEHVFSLENGMIHISGTEFGYLITKREYANYYLRAEFKWGEATHPPREGKARDSGILYHIQGPQKVWPTSIEFQICEGQTGYFYLTDGAALTGPDGKRVTGPPGKAVRIPRIGAGSLRDVTGYRDPTGEVEKPHGAWNLVELVAQGDHVKQYVNGRLVNEGSEAYPARGKILVQSEGAEVYFREIKLFPLKP
ncbi:MAG: DUF1080 domain-containing protein [Terriglobia bacterium]|jgi:hypothetical protein